MSRVWRHKGLGVAGGLAAVGALSAIIWVASARAGEAPGARVPAEAAVAADSDSVPAIWAVAPIGAVFALVFAYAFYRWMKRQDPGDPRSQEIGGYIREGARAYLVRQYKVVAIVFVVMAIFFAILAYVLGTLPKVVPVAFLTGGFFSALCGWLGMNTSTQASYRTTAAAKKSLNAALQVAFKSGAVMGLVVVGLGLIDICGWFAALRWLAPALGHPYTLTEITVTMLCFGMGASLQALFARVGGGIFTKAADVGSDLVGKVEAGIPEDDPRNPAVMADQVGDNVGDIAGMGADLYESYCGSILATAALAAAAGLGVNGVALPMVIAGLGIVASIVGVFMVRTREGAEEEKDVMRSLNMGLYGSSALIVVLSGLACWFLLRGTHAAETPLGALSMWVALVVGLAVGIVVGNAAEYYTSHDYAPTRGIAEKALTGPATVILEGLAVGMLSTGIPVLTVAVGMVIAFGVSGGFSSTVMGLYGVGLSAVGMLSTLGITLATDCYGPISDNAGGNAEMSQQPEFVRKRTDSLDAIGNTTRAVAKGFAIGSAALTALTLLAAYLEEVRTGLRYVANSVLAAGGELSRWALSPAAGGELLMTLPSGAKKPLAEVSLGDFCSMFNITLMNPKLLAGMFIGSMMVFIFCALALRAVGRAANKMVQEVRRQFKEIPGLLEGASGAKADYARCVEISTAGAQREMMVPSLLAVVVPIVTGLVFGVSGVMGLLAGGLATGFMMAVFMADAGGAWDNAKKYIEMGNFGGKKSDPHKAGVVGDTVGDPFKDTAGPSLNILIKLMSMVSVVVAGFVVKYSPMISELLGMGKN